MVAGRLYRYLDDDSGSCLPVCLDTEKKGGQHMSWDQFVIFAIVALLCWGIGAVAAWRGKRQWMIYTATLAGLAVFFAFILGMWIDAYDG